MKILVVDDEVDLCEILRFNLESEGYEVDVAYSAEEAQSIIGSQYSLLLLDVMMDRMSGFELAQQLRAAGNTVPIIFLTALNSEPDQLKGFSVGADDFITKPFSFATVLARVKAVLKRSAPEAASGSDFALDETLHQVDVSGTRVRLTNKEFLILKLLTDAEGQYFTREQILESVWGNEVLVGDRSVDVHIARLRKKLGPLGDSIVNRSGLGYSFVKE